MEALENRAGHVVSGVSGRADVTIDRVDVTTNSVDVGVDRVHRRVSRVCGCRDIRNASKEIM